MVPFLQLALAGPSKPLGTGNEELQPCPQVPEASRSEPNSGNVDGSENSRSDHSCDVELCKTHGSQVENEGESQTNSRNEKSCGEGISNNRGISPYAFSPAEKTGLFCLCHLVNAPENRTLLRREKLEDYLICVCWFAKRCPEVVDAELLPNLGGFERLEPPRLESIAKAYLAKCFGEKIM